MERVKVILNPYAGRGRGGVARERIHTALQQANVRCELAETQGVGHAIELARAATLAGFGTIVAVGGDGTISEVVNGMAQATPPGQPVGKLGILPLGTANDFAAMAGCPRDLHSAAQAVGRGETRRVDLGFTQIRTADATVQRYFDNNLGVGFEAWVTLESYKIKRLTGTLLYVVAALRALRTCPAYHIDTVWEDATQGRQQRSQRTLLISVGNSRRTGGGFYLTPDARLDDGLLDVGLAAAVSRLRILWLLPKALFGKHVTDPAMTMLRCRTLYMDVHGHLPVHVDGEVVARQATRIEVSVQPGRLAVIV
jgi:YegS/Rv2252/BmrU family lipid kinase